jgi:hypothetical protein
MNAVSPLSDARSRRATPSLSMAAAVAVLMAMYAYGAPAVANGYGENTSWQFETTADKANKALLEDLILRKKNGYYDSFRATYNYTTNNYIDHQTNCTVSASAAGNSGSNAVSGQASSPGVDNSSSTGANATGNSSSNGYASQGPSGVVLGPDGSPAPNGSVDNQQDNSGTQTAGVSDSSTSASTGPINASGGRNDQALNSDQSNSGSQSVNLSGSTACSLASAGVLN